MGDGRREAIVAELRPPPPEPEPEPEPVPEPPAEPDPVVLEAEQPEPEKAEGAAVPPSADAAERRRASRLRRRHG